MIFGWTIMGRPFLAPPGIPEDRKAALIKAFDATMRDPAFLADAASSGSRSRRSRGARSTASWRTSTRRRSRWWSGPGRFSAQGQ